MKIKQILTSCNIYISLWMLYNLQGTLYSSGGLLSQLFLLVLILWGLVSCCKVNMFKSLPVYFRGLNIMLLMFLIYGFAVLISGKHIYLSNAVVTRVRNYEYLKSIMISLLPIYTMYYYSRIGEFSKEKLLHWVHVFLLVIILQYFRTLGDTIVEEFTNNSGYLFVYFLPCLLVLNKRNWIQYTYLLISGLFILASIKRGAILIGALVIFSVLCYNLRKSTRMNRVLTLFLTFVICIITWSGIMNLLDSSEYFNARLEQTIEGDDSSRGLIYTSLLNSFKNDANFLQVLFGRGAMGTLVVSMNYAHNDWLEILTNQGLLGIIIFANYWICFYLTCRKKRNRPISRFCLQCTFFICLTKTLFSMSYSDMNIYIACAIGLALVNGFDDDIVLIS